MTSTFGLPQRVNNREKNSFHESCRDFIIAIFERSRASAPERFDSEPSANKSCSGTDNPAATYPASGLPTSKSTDPAVRPTACKFDPAPSATIPPASSSWDLATCAAAALAPSGWTVVALNAILE